MLSSTELAELKERTQLAISHGFQVALTEHYVLDLTREVGEELPPGIVANSTEHLWSLIRKAEQSRLAALIDVTPPTNEDDRVTVPSPVDVSELETVIVEVPPEVIALVSAPAEESKAADTDFEEPVDEEELVEEISVSPKEEEPQELPEEEAKPVVKAKKSASKKKKR